MIHIHIFGVQQIHYMTMAMHWLVYGLVHKYKYLLVVLSYCHSNSRCSCININQFYTHTSLPFHVFLHPHSNYIFWLKTTLMRFKINFLGPCIVLCTSVEEPPALGSYGSEWHLYLKQGLQWSPLEVVSATIQWQVDIYGHGKPWVYCDHASASGNPLVPWPFYSSW